MFVHFTMLSVPKNDCERPSLFSWLSTSKSVTKMAKDCKLSLDDNDMWNNIRNILQFDKSMLIGYYINSILIEFDIMELHEKSIQKSSMDC